MTGPRHQTLFWPLLGSVEQAALATLGRPHRSPAGAALCLEGEPSTHVFILISGWVKVLSASDEGRELLLALRGPGDIVGEIAGEVTGYRTATVRAAGPLQSLIIAADRFERFLDQHPAAAHTYRRAMAERRHAADEAQRGRALTNGSQRLARLLLDLTGSATDRGGRAASAPPLSQDELASLIGSSRATVTRALSQWRARGIIRTGPREIVVLDRTVLRHVGGG
jgi:CRP/FNR family transcriptional regulator, cyclic AMP receptor protein